MGSEFLERNKRKSALSALLLILRGRGKYAVILLVIGLVSTPFLISGERLNSVMSFPAVAAALRTVGLGGLVADAPGNAPDMLAAAGSREAGGGAKASFWEKYLRAANAPLPPADTTSTMAMLRGGGDVYGPPVITDKDGTKPAGPDEVKGVVNSEERAKGEGGGSVSLEGLPGQAPGGAGGTDGAGGKGGNGVFGDLMGANLADRHGSDNGPYAGRSMISGPGAADKASGMYSHVLDQSAEKVPVPGSPKNTHVRMGHVGNFAWSSMGRKTGKSKALGNLALHNKKPMFQLSETFTMAALAFGSGTPEYETAYNGATYDGNDVDADFLEGDPVAPTTPSAAFAGLLGGGVQVLQQIASECATAAGKEGVEMGNTMSLTANKSTEIDLTDQPACCDGDVDHWNDTLQALYNYCIAYTTTAATFDAACQTTTAVPDCTKYTNMHVNPCSGWAWHCHWYGCWPDWVGCIFAAIFTFVVAVVCGVVGVVVFLVTLGTVNLFGNGMTSFINDVVGAITYNGTSGQTVLHEQPPDD